MHSIQQAPKIHPEYSGDVEQFVNLCKMIRNLVNAGRLEDQTFWDNFIVRYENEYPTYLDQCFTLAKDPIPYSLFYQNHVTKASRNEIFMSGEILNAVLKEF